MQPAPDHEYCYYMVYKPYNMVSQFVSPHAVRLLGELDANFPPGIHAIGRLDNNSEGLLLLTTNKNITRLLFSSSTPHERVYLVQLNGIISEEKIQQLRNGVDIIIDDGKMYRTPPCVVELVKDPAVVIPTIVVTTNEKPNCWISLTLYEGKYRQVRKMIKAVRHRCKRLIRVSIEDMDLGDLLPGQVQELDEKTFFNKLHL